MTTNASGTEPKGKTSLVTKIAPALALGVFILVFLAARYLGQVGTEAVIDEYRDQKTVNKATEYFTDPSTSEWREFHSPIGQFAAEFPTYPSHDTDSFNAPGIDASIRYDSYSSEADGVYYAVNVFSYPPEVDTSVPDNNLEGSLNGMLTTTESELISSSLGYFKGHRAMDFSMYSKDGVNIKGKIVAVDNTFYQMMAAYESADANASDFQKFINSFELE